MQVLVTPVGYSGYILTQYAKYNPNFTTNGAIVTSGDWSSGTGWMAVASPAFNTSFIVFHAFSYSLTQPWASVAGSFNATTGIALLHYIQMRVVMLEYSIQVFVEWLNLL